MIYSTSLTGMFTGSYSWNSKVGLLWLQLRVFLYCYDFSALLKTARSLLFRRETKVRVKCIQERYAEGKRQSRVLPVSSLVAGASVRLKKVM